MLWNTLGDPLQLLATIWEHIRYCWIPLATLNTQIIFFLNVFSDGQEAATKDGVLGDHRPLFCSRATLCLSKQILPKYKYTSNYCWQPKYHQIPRYLMVFGLPTSNTKYHQILIYIVYENKPLGFGDSCYRTKMLNIALSVNQKNCQPPFPVSDVDFVDWCHLVLSTPPT